MGGLERALGLRLIDVDQLELPPRPAPYAGVRAQTALQVDRARYDDILLRYAEASGCEVRQQTRVAKVEKNDNKIERLHLGDGTTVRAKRYVDASGGPGVLRSAMGVHIECPTHLKNIAVWDYWENAAWATEIGVGGTRVQVMSIDYGWIWFIPLGPTRTSIGLVCPAEHYKSWSGSETELYLDALKRCPRVSRLIENGRRRGKVEVTKDWSFLSERCYGDNWLLVGEAIGFADPVLAAGMTLAHTGAREAAYVLGAVLRNEHEEGWLLQHYDRLQRSRIHQHIRFADFWYASNGQFSDLQEHCSEIAREAGLELTSDQAWQWLARGGFTHDSISQAGIGGLDLAGMKQIAQRFLRQPARWKLSEVNVLSLHLDGATEDPVPTFAQGKISPVQAFYRGERKLVVTGMFALVVAGLQRTQDAVTLMQLMRNTIAKQLPEEHVQVALHHALQALETMISEGWVVGRLDPNRPRIELDTPDEGSIIHRNRDD